MWRVAHTLRVGPDVEDLNVLLTQMERVKRIFDLEERLVVVLTDRESDIKHKLFNRSHFMRRDFLSMKILEVQDRGWMSQ